MKPVAHSAHAMPVQASKHAAPASRARTSNNFDSMLDSFDSKESTPKYNSAQPTVSKSDTWNSANEAGISNKSDAHHSFAHFSTNHPVLSNSSRSFDSTAANVHFSSSQQSHVNASTDKEPVGSHKAASKSEDEDSDQVSVNQQPVILPVIVDPQAVVLPLIAKTDLPSTDVPAEGTPDESTTTNAQSGKAEDVRMVAAQANGIGQTTFVPRGVQTPATGQSDESHGIVDGHQKPADGASAEAHADVHADLKQVSSPMHGTTVQVRNPRAKLIEKHFSEQTTGTGSHARTVDIATNLPARANVDALPNASMVKSASISASAQNHKDADVRAVHSSAPAPENHEAPKAEAGTVASVQGGEQHGSGQSFPGSEQPASDSGKKSGESNHDVKVPDVGASMIQTGTFSDMAGIKSADVSSEHPVVQSVFEAMPKPMQPASITVHSPEFGTIRILISQQPGTTDGSGLRIQIRAADPAARALLNTNMDSLRQKLQTQSVQVLDVKTPAGSATTQDATPGRQDRRRPTYSAPERQEKKTEDDKAFWE